MAIVERVQRLAHLPPISALRSLRSPYLFDVPVEDSLTPIALLLAQQLLAPFLILHTVVFGPWTDHGFQIRLSQCPLLGVKRTCSGLTQSHTTPGGDHS
jgi:hypothetical protein